MAAGFCLQDKCGLVDIYSCRYCSFTDRIVYSKHTGFKGSIYESYKKFKNRIKLSYDQKLFQNCMEKLIQEQRVFCNKFAWPYDRHHMYYFNFFMGKRCTY